MEWFAKNYDIEFTPQLRHKLMIGLARADIQARIKNLGHIIKPDAIKDYHINTFRKQAGLPTEAWIGTVKGT